MKLKRTCLLGSPLILMMVAALAFASREEGEKPLTGGSIHVTSHDSAKYPQLAKISAGEAARIAKEAHPGRVLSIALENEKGVLVYAVEIASEPAGLHELLVDAGNGKILATTVEHKDKSRDEDEGDDDDKDEHESALPSGHVFVGKTANHASRRGGMRN